MRPALLLGVAALVAAIPGPAYGYEFSKQLEVYGYTQAWFTAYEQMETEGGKVQHPSGDLGADSVSGFRLATARVGLKIATPGDHLGFVTQLRLEENPGILDVYARATVARWLSFYAGQLKVPSLYENLQENCDLDFITRTHLADALSDYALSRTSYASSMFYGNKSFQRDLGVAFKGEVRPGGLPIRYFGMVGNGLGANLFIGGSTTREFIVTNHFGHFYYGGRLEVEPWPKVITLGGYASYNRHDNIVFYSGEQVLDLNRFAWAGDARVNVPWIGLRVAGAYGGGWNRDHVYDLTKTDFAYSGWEARLVWQVNPVVRRLRPTRFVRNNLLELTFRYDELRTEADESGVHVRYRTFTPGLNYLYRDYVKVQLDYYIRRDWDPSRAIRTPNNDALILSLQVKL